jgi:thioester reductase-like protein
MASVFPPGMVGYPWSKLVVEQTLLSAQSAGLPVAIMRLPQMGIAARTGYTQSSDIKIRIVMAALDTGVMPSGFRLQWTEPVDTVSELLTAISLNPRRRHAFDDETRARTERWQDLQAERRQAEPRHRYSLTRYGLTAPRVDAAFARYGEFVRGNKVRLE